MKFIPTGLSSKVAMAVLKAQKSSPTLLFGAGIVGVVGTAVLASRATLKLDDILTDAKEKLYTIEEMDHVAYTAEDAVKDKAIVQVQTVIKIGKLYAPTILVGAASIGLLAGSHNILTRRNAAITAAYTAVEKAFKQYRDRVIDDLGEEKDRTYRYGLKNESVVEVDEAGKKQMAKHAVATGVSLYGVMFRNDNPNWNHIPEYNYLFLRCVQRMANDRLRARGHVFLNDVYDDLGVERTPAGAVVGWLKDGDGDNYIDFGIFDDQDTLRVHDYITGREGELFLDFNVDGIVYDKI